MKSKHLPLGKIFLWLLVLLSMMISYISPLGTVKVDAATKNVYFIKEIGFISSFDGFTTPNGYAKHSLDEQDNYILSDADNRASSGNYIYCIEPGIHLNGGCNITGNNSASTLFKDNRITTPTEKQKLVSLMGVRSGFMKIWEGAEE